MPRSREEGRVGAGPEKTPLRLKGCGADRTCESLVPGGGTDTRKIQTSGSVGPEGPRECSPYPLCGCVGVGFGDRGVVQERRGSQSFVKYVYLDTRAETGKAVSSWRHALVRPSSSKTLSEGT